MNRQLVMRSAQMLLLSALVLVASKTTKARECPECICAVYCVDALVACSAQNGTSLGCGWTDTDCRNQGCEIPK